MKLGFIPRVIRSKHHVGRQKLVPETTLLKILSVYQFDLENAKKELKIVEFNLAEYKVFNFLEQYYDVLHTTGQEFIVEDIDKYLNSRIVN